MGRLAAPGSRPFGRGLPRGRLALVTACLLVLIAVLSGCGGEEQAEAPQPDQSAGESARDAAEPVVLPLSNEACLECHALTDVIAEEDPDQFSHELHLQQLIRCSDCHSATGHEGAPAVPQAVCRDCHGLPMPHAPNYEVTHGEDVLESGDQVCRRCHNVYLHCQDCHGVQMPHPTDWVAKHGEVAYPEMRFCSNCHDDQYCLQCHPVEMPHPVEWTRVHGFDVAEQGSEMCATCHEPELCTACHGMPMPHPGDWDESHPSMALRKPGECMLCHDPQDCDDCHDIHRTHGQGDSS